MSDILYADAPNKILCNGGCRKAYIFEHQRSLEHGVMLVLDSLKDHGDDAYEAKTAAAKLELGEEQLLRQKCKDNV